MSKLTVHQQGGHALLSALQACLDEGREAAGVPDLCVYTVVIVKDVVKDYDEACVKRRVIILGMV